MSWEHYHFKEFEVNYSIWMERVIIDEENGFGASIRWKLVVEHDLDNKRMGFCFGIK